MSKTTIAIAVVGILIAASAAYFAWGRRGEADDRVADILRHGQHIKAICLNAECKQIIDFRAHSTDMDWPKECPHCGEETLWRARHCPHCDELTWYPPMTETRKSFKCSACGRTILLDWSAIESYER